MNPRPKSYINKPEDNVCLGWPAIVRKSDIPAGGNARHSYAATFTSVSRVRNRVGCSWGICHFPPLGEETMKAEQKAKAIKDAEEMCVKLGGIEVGENPKVSVSPLGVCWVQAWIQVPVAINKKSTIFPAIK